MNYPYPHVTIVSFLILMHLAKHLYFRARYSEEASDRNHVRKQTLTENKKQTRSLFGTLLNLHCQIRLVPQKNLFLLQMMIGLQMRK